MTLSQPCTLNTQPLGDLSLGRAWHPPFCSSLHNTLHAAGLLLTLVLPLPVKVHESGHQLRLICALPVPERAASCLPSDCGLALAQANQQLLHHPMGCNCTFSSIVGTPAWGGHPPFQFILPSSSGKFYLIVTLFLCVCACRGGGEGGLGRHLWHMEVPRRGVKSEL